MVAADMSHHIPKFSSSEPTVKPIRSDSVLALGKKLVDELGLDQSVDTLGRWMAHYIAEKIEAAEAATGEVSNRKMTECSDTILKLWAHRSELPNGKRPFEEFEPIFRVLQSLDPDDTTPRYFRQVGLAVDQDEEDDSTKQWLRLASGIDDTARALIRYCLAIAAQEAVEKSREWVALAEAISEEKNFDIRTVRSITDDSEQAKIENILKRLEAFTDFSRTLSLHLREQLAQTTS